MNIVRHKPLPLFEIVETIFYFNHQHHISSP
uniref:Uncharacterized protein n=1 Tax=Arundo donax TaxID=35708 RepID=A0A0A9H791_ARUDO